METEVIDKLFLELSQVTRAKTAKEIKIEGEFKNFHRLLCERFGYGHDPIDWKRDQLSLIEHIAKKINGGENEQ